MKLFESKWTARWTAKGTGCVLAAVLVSGCGGGGGKSSAGADGGATGNAPPSIQGAPGTSVLAGQSYSFQPSATDSNGDTLTFTATNLPAWASLNAGTGRLTGTPTMAQIGSYSGITITVSDGRANASLSPFAIAVTDTASGSATLSWVPPTRNADGSALSNLSGYQIRYGRDTGDLTEVVVVANPSINRYVVENLSGGIWYFAVVAVNGAGSVSPLSNLASKTIS